VAEPETTERKPVPAGCLWAVGIVAGLLLLGMASNLHREVTSPTPPRTAPRYAWEHARHLTLSVNEWLATPGQREAIADLVLANNGPFAVREIRITCTWHDDGKATEERTSLVPDIVAPGMRLRRDVRFGDRPARGSRALCFVIDAERASR